ncbi:unnamed protein product (macronuclear) [Paramecium tetraurelia]|uniref:Uncharacterized protein n=1 Tax=Paramecium tetraurelia TaxID=5888 RepID=A0BK49_PARTE|nr:uncharacterized protein GSPATT00029546001 [Paramecium tetraurelia]CAK58916.1 unnamed protein product [Paramecium tetraurelia]|eukprot:XP_001426314.1 hypothetical protein (macronuclear) [Paramecium tetraurelia strain d4-2]
MAKQFLWLQLGTENLRQIDLIAEKHICQANIYEPSFVLRERGVEFIHCIQRLKLNKKQLFRINT